MKINNSLRLLSMLSLIYSGTASLKEAMINSKFVFQGSVPSPADDVAQSLALLLTDGRLEDIGPISQKSRATAFVHTPDGLKIECWEINGLLRNTPEDQSDGDARHHPGVLVGVDMMTWPPDGSIFPPGEAGVQGNALDWRSHPQ